MDGAPGAGEGPRQAGSAEAPEAFPGKPAARGGKRQGAVWGLGRVRTQKTALGPSGCLPPLETPYASLLLSGLLDPRP